MQQEIYVKYTLAHKQVKCMITEAKGKIWEEFEYNMSKRLQDSKHWKQEREKITTQQN